MSIPTVSVYLKQQNFWCRGHYKNDLQLPVITGHDVSGVIVEIGTGVKNFEVCDEVY